MDDCRKAAQAIGRANDQYAMASPDFLDGSPRRVDNDSGQETERAECSGQHQRGRLVESQIEEAVSAERPDVPGETQQTRQQGKAVQSRSVIEDHPEQHHVQDDSRDETQQIDK
ncbi:MAG: hypothetical protein AUI64_02380 [Acidobacteria bacterium 13_1_40CM_2_64_6]|nr:MAG: hypothetical protein AUI64_02380 [Acidobacteria bacterium 13_1_40CM_2_64_6]